VERSSGGSNGATTHVKGNLKVEHSNGGSNGATTHVKGNSMVEHSKNGGSNGEITHVKRILETVTKAPCIEGTVISRIITLIDKDPNQSTKNKFMNIAKWVNILVKGWDMFTWEILIQRSRVNPKPLAFLMMVTMGKQRSRLHTGSGN
jgi:hypothetical protein